MLGKIYSEAKKVVIWLRVETPETAEAIKEMPTLTTKLKVTEALTFERAVRITDWLFTSCHPDLHRFG
jgi:hypothetical protein